MNPQEIEKIKSLIQTSGVLSASEKAEWLALLGMMNDRQLSELEKILNGGVKNKQPLAGNPSHPAPVPAELPRRGGRAEADKQSFQPLPKAALPANRPAQPNLPPLSHIVNLPKNFGTPPPASQNPRSQGVTPEILAKRILETQPQKSHALSGKENFAARLKNIFSEKELPAGIKVENIQTPASVKEKTLPASPIKPAVFAAKLPPPVPKPKEPDALPQAKVLEKNLPAVPAQKPQVEMAPINISASNVIVTGQVKPPPDVAGKMAEQKQPAVVKPLLQNFRPQNSGSAFSAGINFAKPSYKTTEERVAEIKQSSQAKPLRALAKAEPKSSPIQTPIVGLESLDSLAQVSLRNLENYSLDALAAKISLLTKRFGYFDVIFNLEKSPAYKTYIQTGLKLLSDQQDFEHLDTNGQSGDYLSRETFEKFTDLLAKIQTS